MRFPNIYDNKVLSNTAEYFGRTDLGKVFEKCQQDEKMKGVTKIVFDLDNGFNNYEGSELLSHYHEAAYDAYMTGYCFAHILKFKEKDMDPKNANDKKKSQGRGKYHNQKPLVAAEEVKVEEAKVEQPASVVDPVTEITTKISDLKVEDQLDQWFNEKPAAKEQSHKIDYDHEFCAKYHNKVMLSQHNMTLYHLNPVEQVQESSDKDHSLICWVQIEESQGHMMADQIARQFDEYGDFNVYKDSKTSFFMEFYFLEKATVPS